MRHAVRIQPYLSRDLFQKLRTYAATRSLSVSAVVADALGEYLERDEVEDALLVRRLDGVTQAIGQLQRDVDTLGAGFGRFVRFSLYGAPTHATAEGIQRSDKLYAEFLARVCEQLRDGVKFTGQVWRARGRLVPPPTEAAAGKVGGEGEKRP
jgi:hypothetical protein